MIIMSTPYSTKNVGDHPTELTIIPQHKVEDLRYATNPRETAALYDKYTLLGSLQHLKVGKQGLSQTNYEDIFWALSIIKYFENRTAVVMKHTNPCGFAASVVNPGIEIYRTARDYDYESSFGGVVGVNFSVDKDLAEEMVTTFVEAIIAPEYEEGVMDIFTGEKNKRSKSIRVEKFDIQEYRKLPRFIGDDFVPEAKTLGGATIRYDPHLTAIRSSEGLLQYVVSERKPTEKEMKDALTALYIDMSVLSNSATFVNDNRLVGVGAGQPSRVKTIKLCIAYNKDLDERAEAESKKLDRNVREYTFNLEGSSMATDGFFPVPDGLEAAADAGVKCIVAPRGGEHMNEVIEAANKKGVTLIYLPEEERHFRH